MNITKITREMVQELAETGAVQFNGLSLGLDVSDRKIRRLTGRNLAGRARYDAGTIPDELARPWSIISEIAEMAGETAISASFLWQPSNQRSYRKMQTDDFHLDQTVFSRGFTLLESASKIPRERLATAGRGPTADPDNTKRLYYSKGLICITQFDFGSVIVPEGADTGQTWHEGLRSEGGMLALIDVITEPTALPRT